MGLVFGCFHLWIFDLFISWICGIFGSLFLGLWGIFFLLDCGMLSMSVLRFCGYWVWVGWVCWVAGGSPQRPLPGPSDPCCRGRLTPTAGVVLLPGPFDSATVVYFRSNNLTSLDVSGDAWKRESFSGVNTLSSQRYVTSMETYYGAQLALRYGAQT